MPKLCKNSKLLSVGIWTSIINLILLVFTVRWVFPMYFLRFPCSMKGSTIIGIPWSPSATPTKPSTFLCLNSFIIIPSWRKASMVSLSMFEPENENLLHFTLNLSLVWDHVTLRSRDTEITWHYIIKHYRKFHIILFSFNRGEYTNYSTPIHNWSMIWLFCMCVYLYVCLPLCVLTCMCVYL